MNFEDKIIEIAKIEKCPNHKLICPNIRRACKQIAELKDKEKDDVLWYSEVIRKKDTYDKN